MWTQIIGKIRLKKMPWLNHSWHVTLYVSPRGLTTGSVPFENGIFQIELDFISHEVLISASNGLMERIPLYSRSVAHFYRELFAKLEKMELDVLIHGAPNEIDPAIPFELDERARVYIPEQINHLWQALVRIERVFTKFRAGFIGKTSPVHFFWGSFDLAVTRFSGRKAPEYAGGPPNIPQKVMQEAYSHEVSSCGFWPGSEQSPVPVFYAYCYPTPEAFSQQAVEPSQAFYSKEMGEFFLPYEAVQQAGDPEASLLQFLRTTYTAAARTGDWDKNLECDLTYLETK